VALIAEAVSQSLPQEKSVIRIYPVREISGIDVLRGNFFTSATLKVAGMSSEMVSRSDGRVFLVRYYENEVDCNRELRSTDVLDLLAATPGLTPELLSALRKANGGAADDAGDEALAMINEGSLAFAFVIAGQGPAAFGMPEMFAPSQCLRHHGVIEKSSILMTDGRYSGVTKGACIGHTVPEAYAGGGIGALISGDLLWVRLGEKRIDLLDPAAFLAGQLLPVAEAPFAGRAELVAARRARMEERQLMIAASSLLDNVTNAEYGVVPLAVNRRATLPWRRG
jgi:dihydroxyacid dehydratase/phosphogluconate dehydratase